jgi:Fic family protein
VRRMFYIHQSKNWPDFKWDLSKLSTLLATVHHHQGRLLGRMEALGFQLQNEAVLRTLTLDVLKNSEIENEKLDAHQVRSSIARRLGMDIEGLVPSDRHVEGVVEMMLDATQQFNKTLSKERLFNWHAALFPTGRSGMSRIVVTDWRDDSKGPMQVVSGPIGRECIHFEAPAAERVEKEMKKFLSWFNHEKNIDPILKAGIAHLWFVSIHPFDDGNGRIARTIADLQLARADASTQRFYSMSAQIKQEREDYYQILERTQKGNLDISDWLQWFLNCLDHALLATEKILADVLERARFWETYGMDTFNERQSLMLKKLLENFFGKLTSSKWAKISKCSQDTALRDIQDLVKRGILKKESSGGRSTTYELVKIKKSL